MGEPEAHLDDEGIARVTPADNIGELAVLEHPAEGEREVSRRTSKGEPVGYGAE